MASSARMDELRKKFDENPRRYFAPLANEYRKVGDLEQAIFICQEYLPQQPGHMSGHIVYGQALFESGRQDEARAVFETALALDPENLIALRHLGDIAKDAGDVPTARQWYQRVLEADPRNDEISALLGTLPEEPAPPVAAAPPPSFHEAPTVEVPAVEIELSAPEIELAAPEIELASQEIELTSLDADLSPPASDMSVSAPDESSPAPDESSPAPDMSSRGSAATEGPAVPAVPLVYEQALDLEFTLPDSGSEMPAPVAASDDALLDLDDFALPGAAAPAADEPELSVSDPYGGVLGATPPDAAQAEPDTAEAPAQTFVTETMAELYLRQGHTAEALGIYDQLLAQRPYDDALAARAAAARQEALGEAGPTIREFLRAIFHGAAGPDETMASAFARGFGPLES